MSYQEIEDLERDEEVSNRIKDCEKELWTCDDSIRDAITENLSNELITLLKAVNKCENARSAQLSTFVAIGKRLFEDTQAYLEAQSVELETGMLPEDK